MRTRRIRVVTILTDLVLINLGFLAAYIARYRWQWFLPVPEQFFEPYGRYLGQQLILNCLLILTFSQLRVWVRRRGEFWVDEISRVAYATATAIVLMMAVTFFLQPNGPFSRLMLFWIFLFVVLFISLARLARRWTLAYFYRHGRWVDRVLVIGSGETGRSLIRTLLARPDLGYQAIGYLVDGSRENNIGLGLIPHLGSYNELEGVLQELPDLHTVFIALPGEMHQATARLLAICEKYGVRAQAVPDLLQISLHRVEFTNMGGIPMLGVREMSINRLERFLKRVLDLTILAILAVPSLLVGVVVAVAIKLDSPGPVIYSGLRVGRHGKLFKMYKFRSMVIDAEQQKEALQAFNEADGPLFKIKDDPRLTRVGRFIRRTSLDELPQLINVLQGNMSLVGPRPPLLEEVEQYKPWHRQRLTVIGGLTGLWQVSGRADLTFDELCLLDIYYIENWSLSLDIRLLLQTIPHMLFGRGAY
ncbi:MAG: sugar transferase [Ardenticatenaceae bacterium]|nr:sugar transferase [Anaerolineales bacterium]MCB8982871.1 sugar transferase [Ardenticatenaceae bacterium]MCB8988945.1 sugar transferase [Ardenticatenaceae bacterium]